MKKTILGFLAVSTLTYCGGEKLVVGSNSEAGSDRGIGPSHDARPGTGGSSGSGGGSGGIAGSGGSRGAGGAGAGGAAGSGGTAGTGTDAGRPCPVTEPDSGAACTKAEMTPFGCYYGGLYDPVGCGCGDPGPTWTCAFCAPCPATQPTGACTPPEPAIACGAQKCLYAGTTCECGHLGPVSMWVCGTCPATEPAPGKCPTNGLICHYGDTTSCACDFGDWQCQTL